MKGQFVQKIEWKQTDEQTDTTVNITFPTNAVGKMYQSINQSI